MFYNNNKNVVSVKFINLLKIRIVITFAKVDFYTLAIKQVVKKRI